ncbi:MAG: M48 family metallopeptidase [Thermoguttaceae bacterium]|nr:M48 family metallopeptidase [Thermoguttaceae bacterium]
MPNETITVRSFSVEIIRKSDTNPNVCFYPHRRKITVTAPESLTKESIESYLLKLISELTTGQSLHEYVSGEFHYLWGERYRLQVVYEGSRSKIVKTPNRIVMTVPQGTGFKARKKVLKEWYRQELKRVLDIIVPKFEKIIGVSANEFRVKDMKTKWGTCNITDRRIWINLQLVKKPMDCLEYVVIHELVHLLVPNHSYRFYALVEQFFPTWKESKELLNTFPLDSYENEDIDHDN